MSLVHKTTCLVLFSFLALSWHGALASGHQPPKSGPPLSEFLPIDLAVTPDGQSVYAISKYCPKIQGVRFSASTCKRYLYRLSLTRPPELIDYYGGPPTANTLGSDLEADTQGWPIVTDKQDQYIYRRAPDQLDALTHTKEAAAHYPTPFSSPRSVAPTYGPPENLKRHQDWLYFEAQYGGGEFFRRFHLRERVSENLKPPFTNSEIIRSPYTIWDDTLYILKQDQATSALSLQLQKILKHGTEPITPKILTISLPDAAQDKVPTPQEMRAAAQGLIYFSDFHLNRVWRIRLNQDQSSAELSLLAGTGIQGYQDGYDARFNHPSALSLDASGNLYVADTGNRAIRKITPDGLVTTFYKAPDKD